MLEINNEHKKISSLNISKPKKKIISSLLGVAVAISTYSGAYSVKANAEGIEEQSFYSETYEDEIFIPACYRDDVVFCCNKTSTDIITKKDLENMKSLSIWNSSSDKLDFLKYCTSLKSLLIKTSESDLDNLSYISDLKNLEKFSLVSTKLPVEMNMDNCSFLLNCKWFTELQLKGHINVEPELLKKMDHLKKMTVCYDEYTDIDFSNLNNLRSLKIDGEPYDIAVSTSVDDINNLKSNGVSVEIDYDLMSKLKDIDNKLDSIIDSLNIDSSFSDEEKMNKIILYVLDNLSYDNNMNDKLSNGDIDAYDYSLQFYEGGNLFGALEMDSQICGNYAALVSALSHRLGIYCYHMLSNNHSWNLVSLDGNYYYIDATILDNRMFNVTYDKGGESHIESKTASEIINEGNNQFLDYYMDEPLAYNDSIHNEINFPSYLKDDVIASKDNNIYFKDRSPINNEISNTYELETDDEDLSDVDVNELNHEIEGDSYVIDDVSYEDVLDVSDETVSVNIDGKMMMVSAGALVGVLLALGGAKIVKKKKQTKNLKVENKPENKFRI